MKTRFLIPCLCCFLWLVACEEQTKKAGKPIQLGDPSGIVTETDSAYLRNFTDDISPKKVQSTESEITDMMVEVDSAKASEVLQEETPAKETPIQGFRVAFNEVQVMFDGLQAHTLNKQTPDPKLNSVSFVYDAGAWQEMKVQIEGLSEVKVEERVMTRLGLELEDDVFTLHNLGRFTSPWYTLAGNGKQFVSLGKNSVSYLNVEANKIKQAAQQEINTKKWSPEKKQLALNAIKSIRGYREKPCMVLVTTLQWRVSGIHEGKRVQKLIHIDLPRN
ncbi:MAG: hypothetical protein FGM54_09300 [Chitinophagaceae bacterium]|nr:hypothetical protein [Chitinophagaceae bacterium]